jgi:hypothetical protein
MARKYGYPVLNEKVKRQILGLNSANLYNLPTRVGAYKPVPPDYERRIPESLKATLNFPGFSKPGSDRGVSYTPRNDRLAALREDYLAAGGHPANRRYGWIHP